MIVESCKINEDFLTFELLKKKDHNAKEAEAYECTALSYAALNSNVEVLKLLIDKGADIHSLNITTHYAA